MASGYNGRLMWYVIREKWKASKMPHIQYRSHKNKIVTKYNFNSGLTKKIFDFVIADMKASDIPEAQIPTIMARCGLTKASIAKKLAGDEETHMYEIEHMLEPLNYRMYVGGKEGEVLSIRKVSPNYTFSEELDRIIIKRNIYPKFYINFDINHPTDFEVNFHEETIQFRIGEMKMVTLVMNGIETVYQSKNKTMQGKIRQNIRSEIRRQWLNKEIMTNKESKKRLK